MAELADLDGGTTANPEHLAMLKEGVEVWNQWRGERPKAGVDLEQADLREANLYGANLSEAMLYWADALFGVAYELETPFFPPLAAPNPAPKTAFVSTDF